MGLIKDQSMCAPPKQMPFVDVLQWRNEKYTLAYTGTRRSLKFESKLSIINILVKITCNQPTCFEVLDCGG